MAIERRERLTPVDIVNLRFRRGLNGYASSEVDEFVRRVAADMESVLTECVALRDRLGNQDRELAQYRSIEVTLRDALILAQKAADDTRAAARAQADALLQESQARARELDARAQEHLSELNSRIEMLRQERRRLVRDLRSQLSSHLAFLEQELETESAQDFEPLPKLTLTTSLDSEQPASVAANGYEPPALAEKTHLQSLTGPIAPEEQTATDEELYVLKRPQEEL